MYKSDPADFTTWGKDAVVCDPGAKKCFFAHEIPEKLNNFKMVNEYDQTAKGNSKALISTPMGSLES